MEEDIIKIDISSELSDPMFESLLGTSDVITITTGVS